jgi:hypothetical protein
MAPVGSEALLLGYFYYSDRKKLVCHGEVVGFVLVGWFRGLTGFLWKSHAGTLRFA